MSEIERTAAEIRDKIEKIDNGSYLGGDQAVVALLWVLGEAEDRNRPGKPRLGNDIEVVRSRKDIEEQIEMVGESRKQLYAQNATSAADRLAAASAAYKWLLGETDKIYQ